MVPMGTLLMFSTVAAAAMNLGMAAYKIPSLPPIRSIGNMDSYMTGIESRNQISTRLFG
jgi:hypothetical protein